MPRSPEPPEVDWQRMYKCGECEEILEDRRCESCNKFAMAVWAFECPNCNEWVADEDVN